MPEYPRSPFEKTGTSITPNVDGDALNATIIGEDTPAAGNFTTLEATGQLQGALINNQMVSKVTFDILGLMTDPRFLNLQCEDPGAGTMTDVSGQGHDGTYQGSMASGDRVMKGMGWSIDFDGTDDYISISDHNDFSFGDGTNDEDVTWFGVFKLVDTGTSQTIISKVDFTTGSELREWYLRIKSDNTILMVLLDESANVECSRVSNNGISIGWHTYAITYDGAGGASAANTIKIYIDGELIASTASNNASYVAMENSATSVLINALEGPSGTTIQFGLGDNALTGIDGSVWSAKSVWRFYQLCNGLYGM